MALTVAAPSKQGVMGNLRYSVAQITWDNSYATGGLALTPAQVGLTTILYVVNAGKYGANGGVIPAYDSANSKLAAYGGDGAAAGVAQLKEVANGANLSSIVDTYIFIGY